MKIFVYGSLMQGFGNHRLLSTSKFISETTINYKGQMYSHGSFPAIIDSPKETILYGEVYEVDGQTLSHLDRLEGHPNWYRRVKAITADNQEIEFYAIPNNPVLRNLPLVESGSWRKYKTPKITKEEAYDSTDDLEMDYDSDEEDEEETEEEPIEAIGTAEEPILNGYELIKDLVALQSNISYICQKHINSLEIAKAVAQDIMDEILKSKVAADNYKQAYDSLDQI